MLCDRTSELRSTSWETTPSLRARQARCFESPLRRRPRHGSTRRVTLCYLAALAGPPPPWPPMPNWLCI
eukprot:8783459-Pyramimonas_sp.AAC.1